jgi:hypothetical protein
MEEGQTPAKVFRLSADLSSGDCCSDWQARAEYPLERGDELRRWI